MRILVVTPLCESDTPQVLESYLGLRNQTLALRIHLFLGINECKLKEESEFYRKMQVWASIHRQEFAEIQVKYFSEPYFSPVWSKNPENVMVAIRKYTQNLALNLKTYRSGQCENITHLCCISGDNTVSPGGIETLVNDDKDVVGFPCFHRFGKTPFTNIQKWDRPQQPYLLYDEMIEQTKLQNSQIIEAEGLSLACILMKRHVLEKISFEYRPDSLDLDFSFCKSIKEHGFKIYVDTREIVGHVEPDGSVIDFEYWRKIKGWPEQAKFG